MTSKYAVFKSALKTGWTETPTHILLYHGLRILCCCWLIITAVINIATTTYPLTHRPPTQNTTNGCNGRPEYCDRRYDNISQIGTHGSPFWGILPSHNQALPISMQLDAGIRFLQAQTRKSPVYGQIKVCHTNCLIEDAGTLEDYLLKVKWWLEEHPNEVVTLLLTNGDFLDVGMFDRLFLKTGLVEMAYAPAPPKRRKRDAKGDGVWPTLGEMINKKQRLVVFVDYAAQPQQVPYILDEFGHFWETPFDTTDPNFPQCTIDRPRMTPSRPPKFREAVEKRMYIVNHYLDTRVAGMELPNRRDARKTNSADGNPSSILQQTRLCESLHGGKKPSVVLVDYFDRGEVKKAEAVLNGFE